MNDRNLCPACKGRGKETGVACGANGCKTGTWNCSLCAGEGTVTDQQKEWWEVGRFMRDCRRRRGFTLREEAQRRSMTAGFLADMEHGRIEPVPSHIDGGDPKHAMVMREAVDWFRDQMVAKLVANEHKGGWGGCPRGVLAERMIAEVREMHRAATHDPAAAILECADIANYAMMIADNLRHEMEQGAENE